MQHQCLERGLCKYSFAVPQTIEDAWSVLSPRERDVVQRLLEGQTYKVIAYEMGLAASTVRVFVVRAAAKIRARAQANSPPARQVAKVEGEADRSPEP